jgi:LPXTG-motif cell wall-anchored protein
MIRGDVDETDKTIGNYSIENKQFKFNAGKEPADYTIILKGNITALNNQKDYWSPLPFFDYYSYKNTAVAKAGEDLIGKGEATTTVIDKKGQTTITDSNVFNKGHKTNPTTPVIGEPIEITYTFTVNDWNAGANAVDVSKSTITDIIDPIFDTSKGYEVKLLNDTWDGQNAKYVLSSLDDGVLTINFDEKMPEELKKSRWQISIELTTFPITEQSQALIRNSASLTGSDSGLDYSSSTETSGQTTGGELLVRKTVTDLDEKDYVKNYTLELDSDGNPKHKEFNYKIDLIPQVDFRNVKILPLTDVLPEALEFVGLIGSGESDTATVNRTTGDYANTGGKVEVTYENGELKIANNTSTFGSGSISIRFRVKLKDDYKLKAGDTISNVITETDPPANITIVEPGKYPINITKVDSETGERIEDENQVARFKLEKVGEDGTKTTVYNDIRIDSGQLVDAEGKALVVESIGKYQLTETKAPTGYILSEEPISIRVTENGTIPGEIVVKNTPGEDPEPETTTHTVVKEWEVEEGAETPAVKVTLYNGEDIADVEDAEVELNSTNEYTYTWKDLPADGVYKVVETDSEEYEQVSNTISEDGLTTTITNKLVEPAPETTTHTVVKEWEVEEGVETPAVEVTLYNGENKADVDNATVELNSTNGYTYTWENLPADGVYKVVETVSEEYEQVSNTISEDGKTTTIKNKLVEPEKVTVSGTKTWNDNNNQDGKRPNSITIRLLKNGTEIASKEVTEADGWAWSFTDLSKYENGELITYTITEDAVEGYSSEVSGYNVTNSYTPGKTSVQVTKAWKDNNNQDGKRPDAITIKLLADGEDTGKTLVLTATNNWTDTFTDLDEYKAGQKIVYTIEEVAVGNGYTSAVTGNAETGFTVTNSYTPPTEPTEPTPPTEPTEPTTPTEPTKPTTPTEPTKPTTPTEPTKPTGPTELPKTGEDIGPYLWLSLMCMSVGALLLLFRRKTKIQND